MGGKTVSLRSTVLSLLLCQCGFFVFAKSASLPLFHRVDLILADSGPGAAACPPSARRSTCWTPAAPDQGLLFLRGHGRVRPGHQPPGGRGPGPSAVRYLGTLDCVALMTTHYDGVSDVAGATIRWPAWCGTSRETRGTTPASASPRRMDYHLLPAPPGAPCPRDALRVCRLLKLDDALMDLFQADL